jgi:competence protein ComGB
MKLSHRQQIFFLRHIGSMLMKGYSLSESLLLISNHLPQKIAKELHECLKDLHEGNSIDVVFRRLSLPKEIIGYLYFADQYGNLTSGFLESSVLLEKKHHFFERLVKTIRYPLFLLVFAFGMSIAVKQFIVPQFNRLFFSMNVEIPLFSRLFFQFLQLVPGITLSILALFLICCFSFTLVYKKKPPLEQLQLLIRVPFIRTIVIFTYTHFFAVQLGSLLKGGLSVLDSLTIMHEQSHMKFYQEEAKEMKNRLQNGEQLDVIIKERKWFESQMHVSVAHGQASGNLPEELHQYSEWILSILEQKINRIVSIIQPLAFLFIGVFVVLLYVSLMVPIYGMMNVL